MLKAGIILFDVAWKDKNPQAVTFGIWKNLYASDYKYLNHVKENISAQVLAPISENEVGIKFVN